MPSQRDAGQQERNRGKLVEGLVLEQPMPKRNHKCICKFVIHGYSIKNTISGILLFYQFNINFIAILIHSEEILIILES